MRRRYPSLALWIAAAACVAVVLDIPAGLRAEPTVFVFQIHVHVPSTVDTAWIDQQVATSNAVFASANVGFLITQRQPLDDADADATTRAAVRRLAGLADGTAIDVFVVRSLPPSERPDSSMAALCRRSEPRIIALLVETEPQLLAHELGHYFGLRHVPITGDVMVPFAAGVEHAFLVDFQMEEVALAARAFARAGRPALAPGL